jgi:hypothetical protein
MTSIPICILVIICIDYAQVKNNKYLKYKSVKYPRCKTAAYFIHNILISMELKLEIV